MILDIVCSVPIVLSVLSSSSLPSGDDVHVRACVRALVTGGTLLAAAELEDFLEQFSSDAKGDASDAVLDISPLRSMIDLASGYDDCVIPEDEAPGQWCTVT